MKEWLNEVEQVLINNRLAAVAGVAGVAVLRGVLITAGRGVLPDGMALDV